MIDDPSNVVCIPRLKHERITGEYNGVDDDDPDRRREREKLREMDFAAQRERGLKALRDAGVLK